MGWTPLMWAVHNCHLNVALKLLQAGASTTIEDKKGKTVFDLAYDSAIKKALNENSDLYDWLRENDLALYAPKLLKDPNTFFVLSKLRNNFLKLQQSKSEHSESAFITNIEIGEKLGGGAFGEVYKLLILFLKIKIIHLLFLKI